MWKISYCCICLLATWWTSNHEGSSLRLFTNTWIKWSTIKERQSSKRIGKSFEYVLHRRKYSNGQLIYAEAHDFTGYNEMQLKTIMRIYCPPIRLANVKKSDWTKYLELLMNIWNNEKLCRLPEEIYMDKATLGNIL